MATGSPTLVLRFNLKVDEIRKASIIALYLPFSVVTQDFSIYISPAHVISGNDVLFKCDIPSFVSDFVSVTSWVDNTGKVYNSMQGNNEQLSIS